MEIFVTGGTGLIARYIVNRFHEEKQYHIFAIVSSGREEFAKMLYKGLDDVEVVSADQFFEDISIRSRLSEAYVIHTAFTRKNEGVEIAKSQQYAYRLFRLCKEQNVKAIINFSSRSVYKEPLPGELNTESSEIDCNSLIATAKFGTELLLNSFFDASLTKYTSLRCASVNELKTDNNMTRPLNVFVDCVINHKPITVFNGNQIMSFVDPRDVAQAVLLLCKSTYKWFPVYNVGPNQSCTCRLIDMAKRVVYVGSKLGYGETEINIVERDIQQTAGLDSSLIQEQFGYNPQIDLDMMIHSLFEMKEENS